MKKALFVLPVIAAAIAFGGPVSPSSADENALGRCPDHYQPAPAAFIGEDRNENGVVCVKPKNNGDVIIHDDPNGQPYRCNGTAMITNPDCFEDASLWEVIDDELI